MKKFLAVFLVLTLAFSVSACKKAEEKGLEDLLSQYAPDALIASGTCGPSIEWELTGDGTLTLIGSGKMTDKYQMSFSYDHTLLVKKVIFGEGITHVGEAAFYGCENITDVELNAEIESIGQYAFNDCKKLKNITIPQGVRKISMAAFAGCSQLEAFAIPDSVTILGAAVFSGCKSLKHIEIGAGVGSLDGSMFWGCESLEEITVPENVNAIEGDAFYGCKNLKNIYIEKERGSMKLAGNGSYWDAPSTCKVHWKE